MQEGGDIEALAFSVEEIGARRYNAAQASLRRACERLMARRLIDIWSGQFGGSVSIFIRNDIYNRTGIGLTETGVTVADTLLQADAGVTMPPMKKQARASEAAGDWGVKKDRPRQAAGGS